MPVEIALEAAKQLSSTTYLTENEQCFIFVPSDISLEQKKISKDWLDLSSDSGMIGIFVYARERKEFYIANGGKKLDKNAAKKFILDLNGKITEENLDKSILYEITIGDLNVKAVRNNTREADEKEN